MRRRVPLRRVSALIILAVWVLSAPAASVRPAAAPHDDMRDAVLIVGNFNFDWTTDGILRYDGRGRFIDVMVPDRTANLDGPCCMAFGPDDNLYVTNFLYGNVLRFNGLTGEFIDEFVPSGSGGLIYPLVAVFHEGFLYVGDVGSQSIRRYDARTGAFVDTFVQDDPNEPLMAFGDPQHFAFGPDGNLYVAAEYANRLLRYDGNTGELIDQLLTADSGFTAPSGLTFGPDGLLYVGSALMNEVRRFDVWSSTLVGVFVSAGSGGLNTPVGITFGPDGNLYATSVGTHEILRYDGGSGEFMGAFVPAGLGGLSGPRTLTFKSKVRVCHRGHTLNIGYRSGFDHLAHGDTIGACASGGAQ